VRFLSADAIFFELPAGVVEGLLHLGCRLNRLEPFAVRAGVGNHERIDNDIDVRPDGDGDRGVGWEFVHVCIDDASRIAFNERSLRIEVQECVREIVRLVDYQNATVGLGEPPLFKPK
jgi:hypothetical protein